MIEDVPWVPGDRVGGIYVVRAPIGRGGMSTVWDAWDSELRRAVALKTIDDPADTDELLINEARALAGIRHPGLPVVHALGVSEGRRYLVLERLYGETLEQRLASLDGDGFDLPEGLRLLGDVADILHAVHTAGMVHHDVKPGNIMLCREHRTVLLDFGVMLPRVRADGAWRVGTPGYVAPEVLLNDVTPGRAPLVDMYAFGVIAFEVLSGRPPFPGSDHLSLLQNHAFTPAPELRSVRPDLPPSIEALVRSCLAKDPGERPTDMELVSNELRQMRTRLARRSATIPPGASIVERAARESDRLVRG